MVDAIIVGLKSLSVSKKDKWRVKNAIESMESIQRRRAVTARAVQRNIDDTMEAIDFGAFNKECGCFRDQVNDGCASGSLLRKIVFPF